MRGVQVEGPETMPEEEPRGVAVGRLRGPPSREGPAADHIGALGSCEAGEDVVRLAKTLHRGLGGVKGMFRR